VSDNLCPMGTHITVREQLVRLQQWLAQRQSFLHVRFNDGECAAMFRKRPPAATASGEHHFFHSVGDALLQAFTELARQVRADPQLRVIVGTYWSQEPNCPCAQAFSQFLDTRDLKSVIPWGPGDLWYNTELERQHTCAGQELLDLFDAIRKCRSVVLVGNHTIADARHCMGARFVEVPRVDAWLQYSSLMATCGPLAAEGAVFVWCAGFPGKVGACELWAHYPQSTHIDAGAHFDAIFGVNSRSWMQRAYKEHWAHWKFYTEQFADYVKRAIP